MRAEILLWRKFCLDSHYGWVRNGDGEKPGLCKQTLYPTAMLDDTISMGVEPATNSRFRTSDLL